MQAGARSRGLTNGGRLILWGAIGTLLLAPAVAMRFTPEVAWTAFDFLAAALLLVSAGFVFEVLGRLPMRAGYRRTIAVVLLAIVALVWAHGAVGVF